jgi:thioredoxin-dependent peroxiredoxin
MSGQGSCEAATVGTSCTSDAICGLNILSDGESAYECQGPSGSQVCCVGSGFGCADPTVCCSGACNTTSYLCDGEYPVTSFPDGGPKCSATGTACLGDGECCAGLYCNGGSCGTGSSSCGTAVPVGHSCTTDGDCCSTPYPETNVCEGPEGHRVCCIASGNYCGTSAECCRGLCDTSANVCEWRPGCCAGPRGCYHPRVMLAALLALSLGSVLQPGTPAPAFAAKNQDGKAITLAAFKGHPVVLYFYPKDRTPGWTLEARGFRDASEKFKAAGAVVLGVSSQDQESHQSFCRSEKLNFNLLADTERDIAKAYGVGSFLGMNSRVTFLIDRDGVIRRVWESVSPGRHPAEVLEAIQALQPAARP